MLVPVVVINILSGLTVSAWSGVASGTDSLLSRTDPEYTGLLVPFISVPTWLTQLPSSRAMANIYYLQILLTGICTQVMMLKSQTNYTLRLIICLLVSWNFPLPRSA